MTSTAELLLSEQLRQAGIPFEQEYRFAPPRRWRFDAITWQPGFVADHRVGQIAVEIEGGSYTGGHKRGKAYESDCDKHNAAMDLGWKVYRFTPAHVEDGRALAVIRAALGLPEGVAA